MTNQPAPPGGDQGGAPGAVAKPATPPVTDPSAPLASGKPAGTRLGFSNYLGLAGALLAMIALFSVLSSHFLSYDTFSTIANQIPDLVVMAVGMTFVLIIAGIDLSVGSVLALGASVVSVVALQWHWPPLPAALLGVAAAALTGMLTGAVTVGWRIPSFIVSLGVLEAARGVAYQMTNSRTAYIGDAFDVLSNPIAFGISPAFLIAVAVMVIAHLVLTRTVFGRYLVGIGTNEEAVRLAGVNPRPYKVVVFALMGALAGLAALFQISRLEAADPNAGDGIELQVQIAAVVIGGIEPDGWSWFGDQHLLRCVDHLGAGGGTRADRRERADQTHHHRRGDCGGGSAGYVMDLAQARLRRTVLRTCRCGIR